MKLFTIGFTRKTAERFFSTLKAAGVQRVVDIRLNNVSQLAGFAKRDDLCYFLATICGIDYIHVPELAPTRDLLDNFKKKKGDWAVYERTFNNLIAGRNIARKYKGKIFDGDCLLCSEATPDHCHRRLVAEYLQKKWGGVDIVHL
jgi:uncharacterized protein (DUF488 family)